ncbi:MAG TPA: MarR family winged helix-turn-helix transcriptional regulator [Bryobacteraceae bacterium]|jgi:DNA-binding MarR family transcriptional regulator|nr:MarR family winged helix-turn-helix transcriptional regulator [Bryobacteraceae bacterium]
MNSPSLPLPTLLSQVLVALTIEFDNEFERQMPHRTTISTPGDSPGGLWLVSMAMWSNVMQYVGAEKLTVGALQSLARTPKLNLAGMQRWGYIVVGPDPADSRPKPPRSDWLVRATSKGQRAQHVWRPLFGVMEKRWEERFGKDKIDYLRESLRALVNQCPVELPDYLPILGYGLFSEILRPREEHPAVQNNQAAQDLNLPALLAKVLLAFALTFERKSDVSLAICANVVRLVDEKGVRIRDLPRLAGVSKEAIQMAIGLLEKRGYAIVEPDPVAARTKSIRLTEKGRAARDAYCARLRFVEERWAERFGEDRISRLRESLEALAGETGGRDSPLFLGLEPHPNGWRALVPRAETLPHHPMVLHRGGYPDGS